VAEPIARRLIAPVILVAMSLGGPILLLSSSPHGIHATNDSFVYLGAASTLADGEGWTYPFGDPGSPVTLFPPLPSTVLAIPAALDLDALDWALWLNAVALGALLLVVGWIVLRATGGSWGAVAVAMALSALGVPTLFAYAHVWSEPLFYPLEVGALAAMAVSLETRDRRAIVASGILTSLALLTRYAAVSLLATGVLLVLAWPGREIGARLRTVALYAAVGLPLSVAWSVRNLLQTGTVAGRSEVIESLSGAELRQGGSRVASWFLREPLPGPLGLGLLLLVSLAAMAIAAGCTLFRPSWRPSRRPSRREPLRGVGRQRTRLHPAVAAFGLFAILHPLVVLGANVLSDRSPPLNHRILGPMFVAMVVAGVLLAHGCWKGWAGTPIRWLVPLAAALLLALAVIDSVRDVPRELGTYVKSRDEYQALAASLEGVVSEGTVLSNQANIAWFILDRPVLSLPLSCFGSSERPDPAYLDHLKDLAKALDRSPRTVIVMRRGRTCAPFTVAGLRRVLSLEPTAKAPGLLMLTGPSRV
jgi:hypothetical protein